MAVDPFENEVDGPPPNVRSFFRNEFRRSRLGFQGQRWESFVRARWYGWGDDRRGQWVFVVVRFFLAMYWSVCVMLNVLLQGAGVGSVYGYASVLEQRWLLYLTNWCAAIELIYLFLAAFVCFRFALSTYPLRPSNRREITSAFAAGSPVSTSGDEGSKSSQDVSSRDDACCNPDLEAGGNGDGGGLGHAVAGEKDDDGRTIGVEESGYGGSMHVKESGYGGSMHVNEAGYGGSLKHVKECGYGGSPHVKESGYVVRSIAAKESETELPWVYKVIWVLRNVTATCSFVVFASYNLWVVVYSLRLDALDVQLHGVNFLITVIDSVVAATPMRVLHFYQPLAFGITYAAFSLVFWTAGGRNKEGKPYIYPTLNYEEGAKTAAVYLVVLCLLVVPLTHFFICLWCYMWSRLLGPRGQREAYQRRGWPLNDP